jgi:hypothetical protein
MPNGDSQGGLDSLWLCWLPNRDPDWARDTQQKIIAPKEYRAFKLASRKRDRKEMSRASTEPDIESQPTAQEYLDGFPDVSEYIGSDRELALFRRFDVLGARNLLYLQARLLVLEEVLKQYDEEDKDFIRRNCKINTGKEIIPSEAALEALQITKDWTTFVSRAEKDIRDDDFSKNDRAKDHYRKRLDTVLEIQTVLKQYRT